jgi:hypothetical protein
MIVHGATIDRASSFDASLADLASSMSGVHSAVEDFCTALHAGAGNLAIRPVGDASTSVHIVDNPSEGSAGRGRLAIQILRKTRHDGGIVFTLLDIWERDYEMLDPLDG